MAEAKSKKDEVSGKPKSKGELNDAQKAHIKRTEESEK